MAEVLPVRSGAAFVGRSRCFLNHSIVSLGVLLLTSSVVLCRSQAMQTINPSLSGSGRKQYSHYKVTHRIRICGDSEYSCSDRDAEAIIRAANVCTCEALQDADGRPCRLVVACIAR